MTYTSPEISFVPLQFVSKLGHDIQGKKCLFSCARWKAGSHWSSESIFNSIIWMPNYRQFLGLHKIRSFKQVRWCMPTILALEAEAGGSPVYIASSRPTKVSQLSKTPKWTNQSINQWTEVSLPLWYSFSRKQKYWTYFFWTNFLHRTSSWKDISVSRSRVQVVAQTLKESGSESTTIFSYDNIINTQGIRYLCFCWIWDRSKLVIMTVLAFSCDSFYDKIYFMEKQDSI